MSKYRLDPDNPRPARPQSGMNVTHVQRWVATVLTVTVVGHFTGGLMLGAFLIRHDSSVVRDHLAAPIGLNILATITALIMIVAVRAIHRKKSLSPWLALGLLVGAAGFYLTFSM
jgi:hypothetical protein